MAMEASNSTIVSDEEIKKADEDYQKGVTALKANKLEDAVQLLGQALQTRVAKHGADAIECASAYYSYGSALFYRAQEENDVFGGTLQSAVQAREEGPSSAAAQTEPEKESGQRQPGGGRIEGTQGKGKGIAIAPPMEAVAEEAVTEDLAAETGEESEDEEEEEDEEIAGDDMQLAWENLEVARSIYIKQEGSHKMELADVHMLLADFATEQENFESALEDLKIALSLLTSVVKANDRRLAEVHYKQALTLQFLQQPENALKEVNRAATICKSRLEELQPQEDEAASKEVEDLEFVLDDLKDKEAELKEAIKEFRKTRDSLRSVLQQAMGTVSGFSAPSASLSTSQVVDLGIVQGKKRINLAPIAQPTGSGSVPPAGESQAGQLKRSMEDLMGGESSVGFGAATATAAPAQNGATEGEPSKRQRTELGEHNGSAPSAVASKPSLPAFLQPSSVQAAYAKPAEANGAENATAEK